MKRRTEFLDVLLRGAGPSPGLLGAFALGLLVVGLVGNLIYDLLVSAGVGARGVLWVAGVSALLVGLAYLLYWWDRRRARGVRAVVDESRLAPSRAGLIWLFGPGPFDHLMVALDHHRRESGAAHCWLVMEDASSVREAHAQLSQHVLERGLPTQFHPVYLPRLDVQSAYQAVRSIFEREAAEVGLRPEQVVADVTGGTKPLTAGMVLAGITTGSAMEYVESDRDAEGRPVPNTQRVVAVDTAFYLTTEV